MNENKTFTVELTESEIIDIVNAAMATISNNKDFESCREATFKLFAELYK